MKSYFTKAGLSAILTLLLNTFSIAGMISTEEIISPEQHAKNKQTIVTALQRAEVKKLLLEHGADPALVEQRLDQLTDQELQTLANHFEQLPAAGSSNLDIIIIGSGLVILILELTGIIDLTTAF